MARKSEFYRGRRKKLNIAFVPAVIILLIFSVALVIFYGMQKYAIIKEDGIKIELPILTGKQTETDEEGHEVRVFEQVDVPLVFDAPDYSHYEATAGKRINQMRAIFVPAENLTAEKLDEYAARLITGNALVLEMKPRSGVLSWFSNSEVAFNYGLASENAVTQGIELNIERLKERDIYLVAQVSCAFDNLFASHSTGVTLRTSYGSNYIDENGSWIDLYNTTYRDYMVDLVGELFDMGFDEVVLADVMHPVVPDDTSLVYTREMSTSPTPINETCGFALTLANAFKNREGRLSIYVNSSTALTLADEKNGQDLRFFMKLFDRVYYPTDRYAYTFNIQAVAPYITISEPVNRFVPVLINYLPDNPGECSWVLVDNIE